MLTSNGIVVSRFRCSQSREASGWGEKKYGRNKYQAHYKRRNYRQIFHSVLLEFV
jgi:hypothetical protein